MACWLGLSRTLNALGDAAGCVRGRCSVTHKLRLGCLLLVSADQMINVQVIETVWAICKDANGRCCVYVWLLHSLLGSLRNCLQRKYGSFQIEFGTGPHPFKEADGSNGSTCHVLSSLRWVYCNEGGLPTRTELCGGLCGTMCAGTAIACDAIGGLGRLICVGSTCIVAAC